MGKWLWRIVIILAIIAAVFIAKSTILAPKPVPVTVVSVVRGAVEDTITNSKAGTVKARQRASLSPESGGRVVEIPHRKGESVRKGEPLLRLDDATLRAQVTLRARELEEARAVQEQNCLASQRAGRELERYRTLAEQRIVSSDVLDHYQSASETAAAACRASQARVRTAQASAAVLETELHKTVLLAPFDGVVAELSVDVGEWTTPSPPGIYMPAVIELINTGSIYISAPMDEVDSASIKPGQVARVTLDPFPDRSFPGKVTRVAPYVLDVEAQNRTVEIEVELDDETVSSTLLPGTSADVEVILSIRNDVLRIPTYSLLEGGKVLVLKDGTLEERGIEAGLRNWDFTEVVSGLSEADRVVTSLDRPEVKPGATAVVAEEREREP